MSDTAIAIAILPSLIVLTLVLECTRVGCTRLSRRLRAARPTLQHRRSEQIPS